MKVSKEEGIKGNFTRVNSKALNEKNAKLWVPCKELHLYQLCHVAEYSMLSAGNLLGFFVLGTSQRSDFNGLFLHSLRLNNNIENPLTSQKENEKEMRRKWREKMQKQNRGKKVRGSQRKKHTSFRLQHFILAPFCCSVLFVWIKTFDPTIASAHGNAADCTNMFILPMTFRGALSSLPLCTLQIGFLMGNALGDCSFSQTVCLGCSRVNEPHTRWRDWGNYTNWEFGLIVTVHSFYRSPQAWGWWFPLLQGSQENNPSVCEIAVRPQAKSAKEKKEFPKRLASQCLSPSSGCTCSERDSETKPVSSSHFSCWSS